MLDAFIAGGKKVDGIVDAQLTIGNLIFGVPVVGNDDSFQVGMAGEEGEEMLSDEEPASEEEMSAE